MNVERRLVRAAMLVGEDVTLLLGLLEDREELVERFKISIVDGGTVGLFDAVIEARLQECRASTYCWLYAGDRARH